MNERIQELAEQAGVDAGQLFAEMLCNDSDVNVKIAEAWNTQPDDVRQRIFQVIEQKQEKFAKLIIQECARVARATPAPNFHEHLKQQLGHTWDMAAIEAGREIVKHFGVE
jgi:hypothetical protein